ncbi:hypothetical protein AYO41_03145 [Verrucomicrobia bacterium SCGC AG-212-E04]|nr:hypothetical protein AYO41_03145 [Verrucomicrobia bacterium SCGC AG-212-E04]
MAAFRGAATNQNKMTDGNTAANTELLELFSARSGHFRFESGYHGNQWLRLERLFLRPERVRTFAVELAARLRGLRVDAVCGPMVEGAFVGLTVAAELGVDFTYSERFESRERGTLFPVDYRVPTGLREILAGRRVVIVNDVISAGSAVRGTHADLVGCGAIPVGIAALLVLGPYAARLAAEFSLPLEVIVALPGELWKPSQCPLCAAGIPIEDPVTWPTAG